MAAITALVHTHNDGARIGRCLETLYPCDEIVIVDHGSTDGTVQAAREFGARVVGAKAVVSPDSCFRLAPAGWVLCLDPRESLSESLAASLFELKSERTSRPEAGHSASLPSFSVFVREETSAGWIAYPTPDTRLVSTEWSLWKGKFPVSDPDASALEGAILRFSFP